MKILNEMVNSEMTVRAWRLVRFLAPATALVWRSQTYIDTSADPHFYVAPVMSSAAAVLLALTGFVWSLQPVEATEE